MDQQLVFNCTQESGSTLLMASDAALAGTADARSTAGWVSLCAGAAWSWAVESLRLVVLSSTEAEYCGAANACKEVLAQKQLFDAPRLDFHFFDTQKHTRYKPNNKNGHKFAKR
jgi:hypothetical protein